MYQYHANTMRDLHIGRQGEHLVRQILFDLSDWERELGMGTVELIFRRRSREDPYPVPVTREGNTVYWTITARETEHPYREGQCELRYYVGDRLAKSRIWTTYVEPSITTPAREPPAQEQGWFDQVIAAGAEAKAAADRAETAAIKQPYPNAQTGTWWVWDAEAGAYQDSGADSRGEQGIPGPPGPSGGMAYDIGHGLKVENNVLLVDTAQDVEQDNTLPITSAAVHTTVGNIEILLKTI